MLKNRRLKEAIENVGMVNNIDGQNFEKDFVGTAPVSYADAVLRARKRKEACKKAYEDQVKVAREALKKEVSNEEHPEPLDKIKGNKERKMTLDEGLFESFEDEHLGRVELKEWMPSHAVWVKKEGKWKPYSALDFDTLSDEEVAAFKSFGYDDVKLLPNDGSKPEDVVESMVCPKCGKEPCECKVEESYLKEASNHIIPVKNKRKIIIVEDEASIECILNTFINTTSNTLGGGSTYYQVIFRVISDSISPSFRISFFDKDNRQEDRQEEFYESVPKKFDSVNQFINYLVDIYNSYPDTGAAYNIENIAKALGYKDVVNIEESLYPEYVSYQGKKMRVQGLRPNGKYALSEPKYSGLDITNHPEYLVDVSKEEVEQLEESKEDAKVFRVTYKHSPVVFSSVMVKAANEDEAKQKLAIKEPGKDIVGVSVMSDAEVSDMTNRGMSLMEAKVFDDFSSYEPWGAAVSTFDNIQSAGKMDALEQLIDDMYPDGIDRTELNDLLAFESDWVYSMLDMPHDEDVVYDDVAVEVVDDEEE